jgi:hypothetical protein
MFTNQFLVHRHPCFRVSSREAGVIEAALFPTLYLCVSHTEALLMASNTSYHKRLHGSHRFVYHILALFATCKRLAVFTHDFGCEDSILFFFI